MISSLGVFGRLEAKGAILLAIYLFVSFFIHVLGIYSGWVAIIPLILLAYLSSSKAENIFLYIMTPFVIKFFALSLFDGHEYVSFLLVRGLDFIGLLLLYTFCLFRYQYRRGLKVQLVDFLILMLLVYFFYSLFFNSFVGAAFYLRYFMMPLLIISIFNKVDVDNRALANFIYGSLFLLWITIIFFLALEFLSPDFYYFLFNVSEYLTVKRSYDGYGLIDPMEPIPLFNFFKDIMVPRLRGFTFHPITAAYFLSITSLVLCRGKINLIYFIGLVGCLLIGSKGAIILFLIYAYIVLIGKRLIGCFLSFILVFLLVVGYLYHDPHTYSLITSVLSIPSNILGGGLGYGGSVGSGELTYKFDSFEMLNGDSALAVMINMFGVVGLIVYYKLCKYMIDVASNVDVGVYAAVLGVLINGVFQEEAIGFYGICYVLLLCFILRKNMRSLTDV